MNSLRDEVVLLTGASSGIGWATAQELAKQGCHLVLVARRIDKLAALAELVKAAGAEAMTIELDVSNIARAQSAVDAVINRWGRIDILINNAGIMGGRGFESETLDVLEKVMRTNYLGAAALIHAALPHMLARKQGHIINVASIAGIFGMPFMASYCASKFALVGLTEALRREYYASGVAFTTFCPGVVDTPMAADSLKDKDLAKLVPRPKSAEQVAKKIAASCLKREPEVVYGDVPAFLLHLMSFMPRLSDWVIYRTVWQAYDRHFKRLSGGGAR